MTTSGTNNFSLTRNEVIEKAYSKIGVKTPFRILTSEEMNDAVTYLNLIIKSLKADGRYLWKTAEGTLFLVPGQNSYLLNGSTSNATDNFSQTTLNADAISAATSIVVSDTTGFVVGYFIGIIQDNNTLFWSAITNIVGTTITIADPLTYSASTLNVVYTYQTKINMPQAIISARRRNSSNFDTPMSQLSQLDYQYLVNKYNTGNPIQFYYDKQLTNGTIYVWPAPMDVTDIIKFTYEQMFDDAGGPTDTLDFPVEWTLFLIYELAIILAPDYGIGQDRKADLQQTRDSLFLNLEGYDRERYTSIKIQPDFY
ncbi:MAG: hypothetical protein ULS35scaffold63_33 [Phage 33_17]|nr:MAG: hypothetical protein ULS35scaffold63_33 [Phage 33_17]